VFGETYCRETFVATKDAPQAVTANRALRIAFSFIGFNGSFYEIKIAIDNGG
jgi:hypothetical protein